MEIAKMICTNVIEHAHPEWASPIVLDREKDGSLHFRSEYRELNAVIVIKVCPILQMDECLDPLSKVRIF